MRKVILTVKEAEIETNSSDSFRLTKVMSWKVLLMVFEI